MGIDQSLQQRLESAVLWPRPSPVPGGCCCGGVVPPCQAPAPSLPAEVLLQGSSFVCLDSRALLMSRAGYVRQPCNVLVSTARERKIEGCPGGDGRGLRLPSPEHLLSPEVDGCRQIRILRWIIRPSRGKRNDDTASWCSFFGAWGLSSQWFSAPGLPIAAHGTPRRTENQVPGIWSIVSNSRDPVPKRPQLPEIASRTVSATPKLTVDGVLDRSKPCVKAECIVLVTLFWSWKTKPSRVFCAPRQNTPR